jgi:hypothetical protein
MSLPSSLRGDCQTANNFNGSGSRNVNIRPATTTLLSQVPFDLLAGSLLREKEVMNHNALGDVQYGRNSSRLRSNSMPVSFPGMKDTDIIPYLSI